MRPDQQIVVCLSGRGDKDIDHVNAWTAAHGGPGAAQPFNPFDLP